MSWILVGLGNPSKQYEGTRHNVGRDFVAHIARNLPKKVKVLDLNVYMNHSGGPIKKAVPSKKAAERLIVVHDELDLPLGRVKLSFGSSAGGHNGVKSIERALKTREYVRIRVGISPATPRGSLKRPAQDKIVEFVLGKFRPPERVKINKARKLVEEAIEAIVERGLASAMTEVNAH